MFTPFVIPLHRTLILFQNPPSSSPTSESCMLTFLNNYSHQWLTWACTCDAFWPIRYEKKSGLLLGKVPSFQKRHTERGSLFLCKDNTTKGAKRKDRKNLVFTVGPPKYLVLNILTSGLLGITVLLLMSFSSSGFCYLWCKYPNKHLASLSLSRFQSAATVSIHSPNVCSLLWVLGSPNLLSLNVKE